MLVERPEKFPRRHAERPDQLHDARERNIALATFHVGEIRAMQVRPPSELFLRNVEPLAKAADDGTEPPFERFFIRRLIF